MIEIEDQVASINTMTWRTEEREQLFSRVENFIF